MNRRTLLGALALLPFAPREALKRWNAGKAAKFTFTELPGVAVMDAASTSMLLVSDVAPPPAPMYRGRLYSNLAGQVFWDDGERWVPFGTGHTDGSG